MYYNVLYCLCCFTEQRDAHTLSPPAPEEGKGHAQSCVQPQTLEEGKGRVRVRGSVVVRVGDATATARSEKPQEEEAFLTRGGARGLRRAQVPAAGWVRDRAGSGA